MDERHDRIAQGRALRPAPECLPAERRVVRSHGHALKNNAKIGAKYFPDELGVLKAGAAADIIVMDYKPFTPFSDENIDGHILFGMTGKLCRTTIANGKLLMKDRELIGIDEEAENAHILEAAKKLWGALNHREY